MKNLAAALACFTTAIPVLAQEPVSYSTLGSVYTQDFNFLPPGEPRNIDWANGITLPGWYAWMMATQAAPTVVRATLGISTANTNFYFWRSGDTSSDHGFGTYPQNATGDLILGLRLRNDTGETLTRFFLAYTGQQWRISGILGTTAPVNNSFLVGWKLGPIASLGDPDFQPIPALTFDTPFDETGSDASINIDGTLEENKTVFAPIVIDGIEWLPGEDLWIRFYDTNDTGLDHGIALDDVFFVADAGPVLVPVAPEVAVAIEAGDYLWLRWVGVPGLTYIMESSTSPDPVTFVPTGDTYSPVEDGWVDAYMPASGERRFVRIRVDLAGR